MYAITKYYCKSMKETTKKVMDQDGSIPYFEKNRDPAKTAKMIVEEANELVDAINEAYITDDATSVIGEIADVLYLVLKFCAEMEIDPEKAVDMKIERNYCKYAGATSHLEARKQWGNGDRLFYDLYMRTE